MGLQEGRSLSVRPVRWIALATLLLLSGCLKTSNLDSTITGNPSPADRDKPESSSGAPGATPTPIPSPRDEGENNAVFAPATNSMRCGRLTIEYVDLLIDNVWVRDTAPGWTRAPLSPFELDLLDNPGETLHAALSSVAMPTVSAIRYIRLDVTAGETALLQNGVLDVRPLAEGPDPLVLQLNLTGPLPVVSGETQGGLILSIGCDHLRFLPDGDFTLLSGSLAVSATLH